MDISRVDSVVEGTDWRVDGQGKIVAPQPGWARWALSKTGLYPSAPSGHLQQIATRLADRLTAASFTPSKGEQITDFVRAAESFTRQLPPRKEWSAEQADLFGQIERRILALQLHVPAEQLDAEPDLFLFIKLNNLHKAILQSEGRLKLYHDDAKGIGFDAVVDGQKTILYWSDLKQDVQKAGKGFVTHPGGLMGLGHKYIYGPKGLTPIPSDDVFENAIARGKSISASSSVAEAESVARGIIEGVTGNGALSTQKTQGSGEWIISIKCEAANRNRARGDHAWLVFETPGGEAFSLGLYRSTFTIRSQVGRVVMHDPSDLWTAGGTHDELPIAFTAQEFVEILTEVLEDHMEPVYEYNLLYHNCLDYALDKVSHGRAGLDLPLNTHLLQYAIEGQGQGSLAWSFFSSLVPVDVASRLEPTQELAKHLPTENPSRLFEAQRKEERRLRTAGVHQISGMYAFRRVQQRVHQWREDQLSIFDELVATSKPAVRPDWAEEMRQHLRYHALPPEYARGEKWGTRVLTGAEAFRGASVS